MDLASSKNSFMLFRVAKVLSQDGLVPAISRLKDYHREASSAGATFNASGHTTSILDADALLQCGLLDPPALELYEELALRAVKARVQLSRMRRDYGRQEKKADDGFWGSLQSLLSGKLK